MASILDKVWGYKTFAELDPEAARQALKDDRLFDTDLTWAKSMDPTLVDTLYYSDGHPAVLTVSERARRFPQPI